MRTTTDPEAAEHASVEVMPSGLQYAFGFAGFNALSYPIILSSPMILFARTLTESATVLGVVAGMMPLLVICQIPAAGSIARIGYRRFVLAGWGVRVGFIFLMALVPLAAGFLAPSALLVLLLLFLFGFNLSRGISSCAWLPWITALVPESLRGRYLSREAVWVNAANGVTLILSGLFLSGAAVGLWQFSLLFGFSAFTGLASLAFLKRIPDVPPPEAERRGPQPVPWGALIRYSPFRRLLWMNVAWALAYGGVGAFTVSWLKAEAHWSEKSILILAGLSAWGSLAGLKFFESRTDRYGSKPVIAVALVLWAVLALVWAGFAVGLIHPRLESVLVAQLLAGVAYALVNTNNTRLAMVLAPALGRNHFFALFSVVYNLVLGLAPVLWGLVIDALSGHPFHVGRVRVGHYGVFFAGVAVLFVVTLILSRRLTEPAARPLDELVRDIFRGTRLRFWLRSWFRGS